MTRSWNPASPPGGGLDIPYSPAAVSADQSPAVDRRDDEQRQADHDEAPREHEDRAPVPDHAGTSSRAALTMTRHGAWRST